MGCQENRLRRPGESLRVSAENAKQRRGLAFFVSSLHAAARALSQVPEVISLEALRAEGLKPEETELPADEEPSSSLPRVAAPNDAQSAAAGGPSGQACEERQKEEVIEAVKAMGFSENAAL